MFEPAGAEARQVLQLFWVLLPCAAVLWVLVVGGVWYAVRWQRRPLAERAVRRLILLGGVVAPTLLLAVLTLVNLDLMTELRSAQADRTIRITGEQFWWRIEYLNPDGAVALETANDLVLPAHSTIDLELVTADVIHSFWVPALAGKVDMIPGMTNRLQIHTERTGTFRGQCAEFCGDSHALMAFRVRVLEQARFRNWLRRQMGSAAPPGNDLQRSGRSLFLGYGCAACHTIRGTAAGGRLGPDLTHLADRRRLAAETLVNDPEALLDWLRHPQRIKPGARMPAFDMLEPGELSAIAAYLGSLE